MGDAINAVASLASGQTWLMSVFLLSLRLGTLLMFTPVLASAAVPARVRALLVLGLAAVLSQAMPSGTAPQEAHLLNHPGALFQAGFTELALGATMGVGIHVAFSAFTMAGRLLDVQIGFGLGQVIDPISNARTPILATALNQVAVLLFFLVNGHHALLRGVAFSLERFPLGQPWPLQAAMGPLLRQVGGLFTLALALSAPVVVSILMVDLALGALARNLPQINMLTFGIPVKVVIGILALSLWFTGIGSSMTRVYGSIYQTWDAIFQVTPSPVEARR
jgi:flagellar biosynthetic protein FliR